MEMFHSFLYVLPEGNKCNKTMNQFFSMKNWMPWSAWVLHFVSSFSFGNIFALRGAKIAKKNATSTITLASRVFSVTGSSKRAKGPGVSGFRIRIYPARFHWKSAGLNPLKAETKLDWLVVTGTCFIFPYIGNNNSNWRTHIFQRGRYTTNQLYFVAGLCWLARVLGGVARNVCWNWLRQRFSWSTGAKLIFKSESAGGTLVVWARGSLAAWFVEPKSGTWW